MTRTDLHNVTGFHAPTLLAAAAYLRIVMPRRKNLGEATSIVNNEGHMNGFLDAIEALEAAAHPQPPKTDPKAFAPYSQPAMNENQNRP